jgi:DNA-directed RNA polymerase
MRKGTMGARERLQRNLAREHGIEVPHWTPEQLSHAGNWGLDCLLQSLPNVFYRDKDGAPQLYNEAVDIDEKLVGQLLEMCPAFSPSPEKPDPWIDFERADGTPFVRKVRNVEKIRVAMVGGQMKPHIDAVNSLQAVSWVINPPVLKIVKRLAESPGGPKLLKKVKKKGGWTVFNLDMAMAGSLTGPFWLDQNIDTRGRIYPLAHFAYQRPDHIRGLLKFERGEPVGEDGIRWLKIAVANTFNFDKRMTRSTFEKRLAWVDENLGAIFDAAENPMRRLQWLQMASDPIQFIATAIELKNALSEGPGYESGLPIPFDASCSAAQHYSLLARDPHGAGLTNLTPREEEDADEGDIPSSGLLPCVYEAVRTRLAIGIARDAGLPAFWWKQARKKDLFDITAPDGKTYRLQQTDAGPLDRPLLKILVMTFLYGSDEGGQRLQIYDELRDRGYKIDPEMKDPINYLVNATPKAIEAELPALFAIRTFLRKIAEALAKEGKTIEEKMAWWTSPTGLPVFNLYQRAKTKRPQLWLGDKEPRYKIAFDYGEFNKRKAINAIAPNFIHSMDAAHLVAVANACAWEGIALSCVHDSFAVLPSRANRLHEILRAELVSLYENNDPLAQLRENAARALGSDEMLPAIPPRGDFDIRRVLDADYAFS